MKTMDQMPYAFWPENTVMPKVCNEGRAKLLENIRSRAILEGVQEPGDDFLEHGKGSLL